MLANANSLPGGWLESGHGSISIYVKDFRDPLERKKKLILRPWASVKDVKDQLQVVFNVPSNVQKLYFQGRELKNAHNLQQCGIYQDNVVIDFVARRANNLAFLYGSDEAAAASSAAVSAPPRFVRRSSASSTGSNVLKSVTSSASLKDTAVAVAAAAAMPVVNIHPYGAHLLPMALMKVMHQALQGLALGLAPVLAMDGTGGTYFLKDPTHRNVGCFKPQDEEPFGPNNPRGLVGELGQSGLRRGILSGEACERELAAYLLDRDHFAGVPATSLVEARHPVFKYKEFSKLHFKVGSLQEFVRHDDVASDIAPSQFTPHQVHKVVLLDMRLLNTDRNDANILVRKRRTATTPPQVEYELIPIDHGYCLPQFLEIAWCDWCWYNWPQLQQPLSAEDKAYVLGLNPVEDADRLAKKIPLRRACRRNMVIAGMIVQKGAKADLVLYEIAKIMCREDLDTPSTLEKMCLEAFQIVQKQKKSSPRENGSHSNGTSSSGATVAPAAVNGNHTATGMNHSTSRFSNLRISTDVPAVDTDDGSPDGSAANSGARSPPGFWASFTPFSSEGPDGKKWSWADSDDEDDDSYTQWNPKGIPVGTAAQSGGQASSFVKWDEIAANALNDAADGVASRATEDEDDRSSVVSSQFASDVNDKDEFEVLNEALDENLQDEKLFLGILGRLMDEKINECVSRVRSTSKPSSVSSSSRRS